MRFPRLASIVALGCAAACGGRFPADGDAGNATGDATPPDVCGWPSSLEPLDATPMVDSCRAARMLVMCTGSDGSTSSCLGYEEKCQLPAKPGVSYTCKNQCRSTEFAATCGTSMASSVVPPANCPRKFPRPGGFDYCCTCIL